MNNKPLLALCIATAALLAGCTAYDRAASYVKEPVVSEVKVGMTRAQVREIAGPPSTTITMTNARGTCDTYAVASRDGKPQTYFVSFDENSRVLNKGFQTCEDYDRNPQQ